VGGMLVYATCSLEPEEGEEQIGRFLARDPRFTLDPVLPDELPTGMPVTQQGWLRALPGQLRDQGGCDGFFAARMIRTG